MPMLSPRSTRSVAVLAGTTIAALIVSVAFLIFQLRQRELNHGRLETISLVQMLMQETQQTLDNTDQVLLGVQERLSTPYGRRLQLDSELTQEMLKERALGLAQLDALFVVDALGQVVNSSRGMVTNPGSVADRAYYKAFAEQDAKQFMVDVPVLGKRDRRWKIHAARSLRNPDGSFRGVIVATLSIPRFEELYDIVKLDYVRPMALYTAQGVLIAGLPRRESLIGSLAPEFLGVRLPTQGGTIETLRRSNGDGGQELFAFGRMTKYPLLVSVTDDEVLSLASWRETSIPIAIGALLIIAFIVLISLYLIHRLNWQERLAQELQLATERYLHTVDSVMDAIVAVDSEMRIVLFNTAAENMFGRTAGQVLGASLDILLPQRLRDIHRLHVGRFATPESGVIAMDRQFSGVGLRADGSEFPFESSVSHSVFAGQVQMTAVLRDVSAKRRAEAELRRVNEQLRHLSASLQDVREEERMRISRELHDELGQQLTGLKLQLSWLNNRVRDGAAATVEIIGEMRKLLDTAISSVRRISSELRPVILDDLGLVEAIAWHAGEVSKRSSLMIRLDLDSSVPLPDAEQTTALFRIFQESMTNLLRHAKASKVDISLRVQDGQLLLSIRDDGQGFVLDARRTGIGLSSMQERADAIGAQFSVETGIGKGTIIRVALPLGSIDSGGDET